LCGKVEPKCPDGFTCVQVAGGSNECVSTPTGVDGGGSGACTMPFTGELGKWVFTGASGSQPSTASTTNAPGVVAGRITRSPAVMPTAGADSINATNWPTSGQLDPASYFTLSLSAPAGCAISVTAMSIDVLSSGTGPASASIASSADNFAATTSIGTASPSSPTLTASSASGTLELRIFGFAAAATTGTMRVQNTMSITGAVSTP
jgi:hypothetical protein